VAGEAAECAGEVAEGEEVMPTTGEGYDNSRQKIATGDVKHNRCTQFRRGKEVWLVLDREWDRSRKEWVHLCRRIA
jgi:hypothetical protein